jgi:hypothetical protein
MVKYSGEMVWFGEKGSLFGNISFGSCELNQSCHTEGKINK